MAALIMEILGQGILEELVSTKQLVQQLLVWM